jgi:UDP-glucose 4-epimerase
VRVLVTGGAGFIGSHLTDAFLDRGDEVTVLDDLSAGSADRLDERAVLHKQSIIAAEPLAELVEEIGPDLICHLAAQIDVRASLAGAAGDAQVNVMGTVNVLEAARRADARMLFCSAGGAFYGRDAPIPSLENVLPLPESPHGVAKSCAEQYVGLYNRLYGTRHAVLRLASVYGPRQDPAREAGVVAIFCSRVLDGQPPTVYGDGRQTRDYVYVADVVTAFLAAADTGRPGTWNIGTGIETSVLDLAATIGEAAGRAIEPEFALARPGDLARSALAVDLARRDLGWSAAVPLAAGVQSVYRWIESGMPHRARSLCIYGERLRHGMRLGTSLFWADSKEFGSAWTGDLPRIGGNAVLGRHLV